MRKLELREAAYRILKILAEEKSFRRVRESLPEVSDKEIWEAISFAAYVVKPLVGVERHRNLKVYVDGAAEPNPGPSGIGIVIYDEEEKKIKEVRKYIGVATNNVAEYKALIQGLKESKNLLGQSVNLFSDSQLLINQMNGRFRINDKELRKLFQQAKTLEGQFDEVIYHLIERKKNRLADQLANLAIKRV